MADDPNMWLRAITGARSPEVWAGIAAGVLYVYQKSPQPTTSARIVEALVSALLAYSTSEAVSVWVGFHQGIVAALIASLGYLILDVGRSVVADREMLKEIIVKRLGGRKDG